MVTLSVADAELTLPTISTTLVVKAWLPITYQAFMDYRMGGASISAKGLEVIKGLIGGTNITQEQSGMSKGEWRELMTVLGRPA